MGSTRERSKALGIGLAVGALGAVLLGGAVGALTAHTARRLITPPRRPVRITRIVGVDDSAISLTSTPETRLPGRYGLWFDEDRGHAKLGEVLDEADGVVRRELLGIDFGVPEAGMSARTGSAFYLSPRELGLPTEDVLVETELGPAPAWLVPCGPGAVSVPERGAQRRVEGHQEHPSPVPERAKRVEGPPDAPGTRWAILVHGRAAQRHEAIRAIPAFRAEGWSCLVISYRNDPGAPASPDGRYALGDREWHDVESAIRFATARGARRIVLMGWSMGGALCLQTVTRSALAGRVESLILDSPVVDWVMTLRSQARRNRLPAFVIPGVTRLLTSPWGGRVTGQAGPIDLRRLDLVRGAAALRTPTLIMHSSGDREVPVEAARALAAARPDIVHLEEFSVAHHVRLWNIDPVRWTTTIEAWLSGLDSALDREAGGAR